MKKYEFKNKFQLKEDTLKEDVGPSHYKSVIREYQGKIKDLLKHNKVDGIDTSFPEVYLYIKGDVQADKILWELSYQIPKSWKFLRSSFESELESTSGGIDPITILEFELNV